MQSNDDKHIDKLLANYADAYGRLDYNRWNLTGDQRDKIIESSVKELAEARKEIMKYLRGG